MKTIIVGAGAAGIMAAYELIKKDEEVILLEARDRIGGRIHTKNPPGFMNRIESGAEFIHGNLPLTLKLMKQSGIKYSPVSGEMYQQVNGRLQSGYGESKAWEVFYQAMHDLKKDGAVSELLNSKFSAKKYDKLRLEVADRAQGLDLADISRLSVFSIRKEWANEETQFRPDSGYSEFLQWIYNEAASEKLRLLLDHKVTKIEWSYQKVTAFTNDGHFTADRIVLTLPPVFYDTISFLPEITDHIALFNTIGFGEVIKIALEFEHPFWENDYPELGFLFADKGFTFWTQHPKRRPLLIGWLGNRHAADYDKQSDEAILRSALENLEKAFAHKFKVNEIYKTGAVFRYTKGSDFQGGYSWRTAASRKAILKLRKGIENTIWFAGEALHLGKGTATVEAALQSGKYVAKSILALK